MTPTLQAHPPVRPLPALPVEPGSVPEWVMVARTGAWLGHPTAPEIITPEHLRSALDYFRRHYSAHGADLVVDYHHASLAAHRGGALAPAAGWVQKMELRAEGTELWGRVLWTGEAASAIAARRYRHLSPVLRFGAPDRLSGRPVPMLLHSVALTNTPFLTELSTLNEAGTTEGAGPIPTPAEGGENMSVLDSLARALEREPEQVASELGLTAEEGVPDDAQVAQAVMANAARVRELEAAQETRPPLPDFVCNALGVTAEADETELKAALIRLKAPGAGMAAVREALALPAEAPESEVLNAIAALREERRRAEAEELVDGAVEAGRIPPAHREFYLREALNDLEATRAVVNSMPAFGGAHPARRPQPGPALEQAQRQVCRQLGLSAEAFAAALN
jgi:phage I-like protein